jgi:hypothetical protein
LRADVGGGTLSDTGCAFLTSLWQPGAMSRRLESDVQIRIEPIPTDGRPDPKHPDRMKRGLIGSSMMHVLGLLILVFGLPWLAQAPPEVAPLVPVNLVQLGDKTAAPPAPVIAPVPQAMATEVAQSSPAEAVPVAQTPPPLAALRKADERSAPEILAAMKSPRKEEISKPVKGPKPDLSPAAKLQRQPMPDDDLSAQLKRLAQLRQPAPPMPSNPRQQEGAGFSNLTATSADAAASPDATYSVKDFIRAQVERRWNVDGKALTGGDWVVDIHIVLNPDGKVMLAEIVDSPRYHADSAYRDFAFSARNAVLLSSPLILPPEEYDIAKDIVVDFNSKQVFQ